MRLLLFTVALFFTLATPATAIDLTITGGWNTSATPAGATTFTPSASATNTTVTAGNTISVYVGATVSPGAAQAAGAYTGVVTMSAVYY